MYWSDFFAVHSSFQKNYHCLSEKKGVKKVYSNLIIEIKGLFTRLLQICFGLTVVELLTD